MLQRLNSQLHQSLRRQVCAPCPVSGACPPVVRHYAPVCRPVRSPCPVPQGPPPKVVTNARRREQPPDQEPNPVGDGNDYLYVDEDEYEFADAEGGDYAEQLDPISSDAVDLEGEGADEEGEFGAFADMEDERILEEAAEADRDGTAADDVGEPSTSYPEPPRRLIVASQLFGKAVISETALFLAASYPDMVVSGVQSNPLLLVPGEVFVLHPWQLPDGMDEEAAISMAVVQGASVIVAPSLEDEGPDPMTLRVPEHIPLVRVRDTADVGSRLARAFYDAPSSAMITIGVTGQVGKTTTAWLIRGILEELDYTVGLMSSIEHAIAEDRLDEDGYLWEPLEEDPSAERAASVPFKLIPYAGKYQQLYGDMLPGVNAQRMLAGMRDRGAGVAVLEMGSEHLQSGTFMDVDINVAVVTNLSPKGSAARQAQQQPEQAEHDQDVAALTMAEVASKLQDPQTQILVINADDPLAGELMRAMNGRVPVVTFGVKNRNVDVWAESIKYNIWETEVIVNLRDTNQRLQIITNLLGEHNVYNLLAAVATGMALKVPVASIVAGVEAVEVPGRSEVLDEGQEFSVVVDAARDPESLSAMLDAARQAGARQIFTVFGCSGGEDETVRPRMGAVAHAKSDFVIITNENPRLDDPAKVVSDIVAGFPDDLVNRYSAYAYFPFQDQGRTPLWFEPYLQKAQRDNKRYIMEDRYSAIRAAIGTAGPDDVVLLTGKGHQDYVVHAAEDGGVLVGWLDDRVEARNALSKLKYLNQVPGLSRETLPWGTRIENLMESLTADPAPSHGMDFGSELL